MPSLLPLKKALKENYIGTSSVPLDTEVLISVFESEDTYNAKTSPVEVLATFNPGLQITFKVINQGAEITIQNVDVLSNIPRVAKFLSSHQITVDV